LVMPTSESTVFEPGSHDKCCTASANPSHQTQTVEEIELSLVGICTFQRITTAITVSADSYLKKCIRACNYCALSISYVVHMYTSSRQFAKLARSTVTLQSGVDLIPLRKPASQQPSKAPCECISPCLQQLFYRLC